MIGIENGTLVKGPTTLRLDIGDWNMDTGSTVNVAHGLSATEWKTIQKLNIMIRDDADTTYYTAPFENGNDVFLQINSTNIVLFRTAAGSFDSALFDSISFNRGWVTIDYIKD